jgi:comEA protein
MFGLSRQEQLAILFLLVTFMIGCFVRFMRDKTSVLAPTWPATQKNIIQDFRSIDSSRTAIDSITAPQAKQTMAQKKIAFISKVNINTAEAEELQTLEKVGPVLALRIIEYREKNGPFRTIEQLKQVKGIGEKTFLRLKDQISIEQN